MERGRLFLMEGTVRFVAIAGPLQRHSLRDHLNDVQPGLHVINDGHRPHSLLESLSPIAGPSDVIKFLVTPPPNNCKVRIYLCTLDTTLLAYFIIKARDLTG